MTHATTTFPRLSWSQVYTYQQCPAKHFFSKCFPAEFVPSALKFGSAVHKALAAFYIARQDGCGFGVDELMANFDGAWSMPEKTEVRFGKDEDARSLREMAERMFSAFLDAVQPGEVLAVEQPFAVEIGDGLLVTGIVDLVEIKDGRFWIVDHKTSKGTPSSAFDAEQVALYRLGLQELGVIPEGADVCLRYDVLRKLKTKGDFISVEVQVAKNDFDQLKAKLAQVWRAIEAGIVYRVRGWQCAGCPWSEACATVDLGEETP